MVESNGGRQARVIGIAAGCAALLVAGVIGGVLIVRSKQQVVTIKAVEARTYGDPPVHLSARASSGLPVQYSVVSGPCTVAGSLVTIKGAGLCRVRASQNGTDGWHNRASAATSFAIAKANQTIDFGALPGKTSGDGPFDVHATASSGAPVAYLAAGPCTIVGSTVSIATAGSCSITARQDGSADYLPATPVTQSIAIAPHRLGNGQVLVDDGSRNGLGQLTIQNGQDLDAVAVLATSDGKTVFSVSIQAQQTYTIDSIRDGTYNFFFELGTDWSDRTGSFNVESSQDRLLDPVSFKTVAVAGGLQYVTITVTLQPVAGGNAPIVPVTSDQFPKVQ